MCLLHNDGSSLGGGYRHPILFPRGLRGVVDNRVPVHVYMYIHILFLLYRHNVMFTKEKVPQTICAAPCDQTSPHLEPLNTQFANIARFLNVAFLSVRKANNVSSKTKFLLDSFLFPREIRQPSALDRKYSFAVIKDENVLIISNYAVAKFFFSCYACLFKRFVLLSVHGVKRKAG